MNVQGIWGFWGLGFWCVRVFSGIGRLKGALKFGRFMAGLVIGWFWFGVIFIENIK